jgi:hypothetical protein
MGHFPILEEVEPVPGMGDMRDREATSFPSMKSH